MASNTISGLFATTGLQPGPSDPNAQGAQPGTHSMPETPREVSVDLMEGVERVAQVNSPEGSVGGCQNTGTVEQDLGQRFSPTT